MDRTHRASPARRVNVLAGLLLGLGALAPGVAMSQAADAAAPTAPVGYAIAAGELGRALDQFAEQSGLQLIYDADLAVGKTAPAVQGDYPPADALQRLLEGSGLQWNFVNERTLVLRRDPAAAAGAARYAGIEEVIVTGQKREERMQDVPIAITAFSMDALDAQKIEGGFDLLKAVPNVTFSKTNFTGYNFQIRGIGTQAISATTDPGVAVSQNNTTLIVNRLFEQEYLDIERVEVLRGPQGTLYGRNATAGVINVITAKPKIGVWEGELKLEGGNYSAQRMRGHINIPLFDSDTLAARIAYASTQRDGFGTNLAAGQEFIGREAPSSKDLDNRDLWTGRFSLGWEPTDRFRADLIYERFEEDDNRLRTSKQLCHRDRGDNVAGEPLHEIRPGIGANQFRIFAGQLSQGCQPGSLFVTGSDDPNDNGAFGVPHSDSYPFIKGLRSFTPMATPTNEDLLAGSGAQSQDLRAIFTLIQPEYRARSELVELSLDFEVADGLTLSSQTVYVDNDLFSTQDFLRFESRPGAFIDSTNMSVSHQFSVVGGALRGLTPGGVFDDPQLGRSDRVLMQDVSQQTTRQLSQELRLVSNFDGPLNYSVGANYTRFENTADYFVFSNALTLIGKSSVSANVGVPVPVSPTTGVRLPDAVLETGELGVDYELALLSGFVADGASGPSVACGTHFDHSSIVRNPATGELIAASCIYTQPDSLEDTVANPEGHNFFLSRNPYLLNSASLFGELYYELMPALKLTAGLRLNWDRKTFTPVPSQTLLPDWRGRFQVGVLGSGNPPRIVTPPASVNFCDPRRRNVAGHDRVRCGSSGLAENGRGYPVLPDIVQEWRVPTGRIGLDWKPELGLPWLDETLLYAFYTRGYKAGGANPPGVSPPQGILMAAAQGAEAPPTFAAEYVNALEIGAKNTLFGGVMQLSANAFYYDYSDYQVSKIVDRSAANENFDATIWGLELETMFAPTLNTMFNASIGYLRTRLADDQRSLDLMDRTQGGGADHWIDIHGNRHELDWDEWVVVKPNILQASNCVAPAELVRNAVAIQTGFELLAGYCPAGGLLGVTADNYDPFTQAPNGAAGFFAEIGGNELPNAPRFTVSLGAQHTLHFRRSHWSATGRVDWYWQDKSFHRVYNTEYDRLQDWTNTNLSFWVDNERHALTIELYVKNVFDETPVTGAFLNSDDTGLSTNVFTLDPRLVGLSVRKRF